jgi:putative peptidoglycan lipid II flippase
VSDQQPGQPSLARSSAVMAAGTLLSRGTGFLRTIVLAAAIGVHSVGNAYNVSNTLPNIIYDLLLGGVLSAVVVPLLVGAAREDGDDGEAFARSLVTVTIVGLAAVSALAVLGAPAIVGAYLQHNAAADRPLAVTLARYFLPQIFFYGVGAVLGAVLNVRGRFAEPMWTPVLNNVVVIVVAGLFFAVSSGPAVRSGHLSPAAVHLLAIGTTAGVVVQTVALLPAVRRVGFRFRPSFAHRHRLREALRLSGWMLVYVVTNQLLLLVVINLADRIGGRGSGYSSYLYAYTLFQLPYAAVSVSVITALMPRLSGHAAAGQTALMRGELSYGLRMTGALIVPVAAAMFVLGPSVATIVFGFGRTSVTDARFIGFVLSAFAVGVVPFSAFQVQLRAFYAMRDTRTPAVINLWATVANIVFDLLVFALVPSRWVVTGLALGFSLSYVVALWMSTARLMRRLRGASGLGVLRTHIRLTVATGVSAAVMLGCAVGAAVLLGGGRAGAAATLVLGGGLGTFTFLRTASVLDIAEVRAIGNLLVSRLRPAR